MSIVSWVFLLMFAIGLGLMVFGLIHAILDLWGGDI